MNLQQIQNEKKYDTDKQCRHGYLAIYDLILASYQKPGTKLLELGVMRGGSLLLWHDWIPEGLVYGVDIKPYDAPLPLGAAFIQTNYTIPQGADSIKTHGPFDIIVDDASHRLKDQRAGAILFFLDALKPGGMYIIEDCEEEVESKKDYENIFLPYSDHVEWAVWIDLRFGKRHRTDALLYVVKKKA